MSIQYDLYLEEHKANVAKGFHWIRENLPELLVEMSGVDYEWQICTNHDYSKNDQDEYAAYDAYFYGGNRSYDVVDNFNRAWLSHIHKNCHHWQHWILNQDDPTKGEIILEMPYNYIIEMICDWWAFSWAKGNLREIFTWWEAHKDYMKLGKQTRVVVGQILGEIEFKLDRLDD